MRPENALLLATSENGTAAALQSILEPHFKLEVFAQLAAPEPPNFVDRLTELLRRIDAAILFLTVFPKSLRQSKMLLESIRRISDLPVVIVAEATQPNDILELLRNGAEDFITLPLHAGDVLPRALKLVRPSAIWRQARPR